MRPGAHGEQNFRDGRNHRHDPLRRCRLHAVNGPGLNTATKIVALTASVQAEDMEKCRAAGMDTLLAKPLRIDTLQAFLSG